MISTNKKFKVKFISRIKGRGLFAKDNILKGEIIDIAYVVLLSKGDWNLIADTVLSNYSFEWNDPEYIKDYESAFSLSISQLINHSYNPNTKYIYDYKNKCIKYIAIRDISKGEEITVNYNGKPFDDTPVEFEVI